MQGPSKADIQRAAIGYVGVPYVAYGRSRQGMDCAGLLIQVCKDCGIPLHDVDHVYHRTPFSQEMLRALRCQLTEIPVEEAGPGDVICLWFNRHTREPQHVAIVVQRGPHMGIVHAYDGSKVVTMGYWDEKWRRRTTAAFKVVD